MQKNLRQKKINVLFLPRWYPNKYDTLFGLFIKRYAEAVSQFCNVSVLFVLPDTKAAKYYDVDVSDEKQILTVRVYYKQTSLKIPLISLIIKAFRFYRSNYIGFKIIKEYFEGKPDLIHVHVLTRLGLIALALKYFEKIPYLITEHWSRYLPNNNTYKGFFRKIITKLILRNAGAVTAVSEKLKNAMLDNKLDNKHFYVIPNVVDFVDNKELTPISDNTIILTVSDLVDNVKNISGVIKAVYEVKKKFRNIEYHLIGDGKDRKYLEKLADNLGLLNTTVFFHGKHSNEYVYNFMGNIDFLITNSNSETFSVATAEALANAKPVIVTRCGGPEFFVNKKNGILIQPNNQKQLQDAIITMISNHNKYDKKYLVESVKSIFSSNIVGKQFYDVYKDVLEKAKR